MKQYLVIEGFKDGCWKAAYERFNVEGRLLPKGLNYLNSWANRDRSVCYQLMETASPELFDQCFFRWSDLVEFDLIPID